MTSPVRLISVGVGCAIGGFVAGILLMSGGGEIDDEVEAAVPVTPTPRIAPEPPVKTNCAEFKLRIEALEAELKKVAAELALTKTLSEHMELEMSGDRIEWPEDVPENYTGPGFQAKLDQAVRMCGISVDILDYYCDEPPCFASVFQRDDPYWYGGLTSACPTWTRAYGKGAAMCSRSITCDDGSERGVTFLAASYDRWHDPNDRQAAANWSKRFRNRCDSMAETARCP